MTNAAAIDEQLSILLDESFEAGNALQDRTVAAAYKTVDTFSTLMNKRLWLKNATNAYTDGHKIGAPFKHEYFYQMVEHEIAHNLFQSNHAAKELFAKEYSKQIAKALTAHKRVIEDSAEAELISTIGMIVNIVEDHRIHSLWALFYPGSYDILMRAGQEMLNPTRKKAHESLVAYFLAVAYDVADVPVGRMDRLRSAMVSALKKVERKGPAATFVVCKWLMTQLVSELIRELQGLPPPPSMPSARIDSDIQSISIPSASANKQEGASEAAPQDQTDAPQGSAGQQGTSEGAAEGATQGTDSSEKGGASSDKKADTDWKPPEIKATVTERLDAFEQLIQMAAEKKHGPSTGAGKMRAFLSDVEADRYRRDQSDAPDLVKQALELDVNNGDTLQSYLERSERRMNETVRDLDDALKTTRTMTEDEWITRDARAKIRLTDIPADVVRTAKPLDPKDRVTMNRLKQLFSQVYSKRQKQLSDAGSEIDIPAYIAARSSHTLDPVFKQEFSGRGFKTLVLIDRSSSMQGVATAQVDRATKILRRALNVPYVEYETWGFQSGEGASVQITRIPKGVDTDGLMPAKGQTPLHIAIRTAVNYLGEGAEKKQLIVLTDGLPLFTASSGRSMGEKQLMQLVGDETKRARKKGINVTAIGIGEAIEREDMKVMFGSRQHWTQVKAISLLGTQMVSVVSKSFLQYLKTM